MVNRANILWIVITFQQVQGMEQLNPAPPSFPMNRMPPMGAGLPGGPTLAGMPFGSPSPFAGQTRVSGYPNEQEEKKKQFARGVFVSGFQSCVTTAMLQKHFSIKPIHGLKHPMTKLKESKGFAFIYYGSEDDAMHVKKTLDRTAILKQKVRITRTVISENISKMMFKLKTHGFSEKDLQERETRYFNDQNLQKEVERIIKPLLGNYVEVNKITVPKSKADKKPLRYARVFFYVSDVKEARNYADKAFKAMENAPYDTQNKNEYEIILNYISDRINNDPTFSSYAKSEIYEYTKKNQSNILHLKGVKANPKEDPEALAQEIKEFIQRQNQQWNILNVYSSIVNTRGAWTNVTFSTFEETMQAYEHLKNLRPKFRDQVLYGSLRNVKDPRTVVISVVKKDVTEKTVEKFLNELAASSAKVNPLAEEALKKYDYFSFNIIESKRFYKKDGDNTEGITESDIDKVHPSWIELNEVPRRLIIHFFHEFSDEDIKELNNDITVTPGYEEIFLKGDNKKQLRSNHQKGHVNKDGVYIKHTEMKGKKKIKQPRGEKPLRRPLDNSRMPTNKFNPLTKPIDFGSGIPLRGAPKMGNNPPPPFRPAQVGSFGGNPPPGMRPPMPQPNMPPPFKGAPQNFNPMGAPPNVPGAPPKRDVPPPPPPPMNPSFMPRMPIPGQMPPGPMAPMSHPGQIPPPPMGSKPQPPPPAPKE